MKILTPSLLLITLFVFGGMVFKITAQLAKIFSAGFDAVFA